MIQARSTPRLTVQTKAISSGFPGGALLTYFWQNLQSF
jgi:hypothetical protein